MREVIIIIDKYGNASIENLVGFGSSCIEATQDIEKLLGKVDEQSRKTTDSYYEQVPDQKLNQGL